MNVKYQIGMGRGKNLTSRRQRRETRGRRAGTKNQPPLKENYKINNKKSHKTSKEEGIENRTSTTNKQGNDKSENKAGSRMV
jgi:hypothetical protein